MAHQFDCVVDTTELARSVNQVNRHVDATTGAVVSMKAAVIAAEKEGADHVCEKVNKGFYSLIHSQISQKMARLQSQVDAQLMRLHQQSKQLMNIRQRMGRDYQMICDRYNKIFNSINRNLRQRIMELDRPVMDLVMTDANQITNRSNQLVAAVPTSQEESVKLSQRIMASSLKRRALNSIESMTRFIEGSNELEAITDSILLDRRGTEAEAPLMVPVVIMDTNYDASGATVTNTYVSRMSMSDDARNYIDNRVSSDARQGYLPWHETSDIAPETMNQFTKLVNDSGLDRRRQELIMKMMKDNPYQTLGDN